MSAYRAPWWLPGAHLQTIYPFFFLKWRPPTYRRTRIDTPDGDFIDIDWVNSERRDAPLVILFHGLEGSSRSHYAVALMRAVLKRNWRGAVVHFRGCGGEPNRLPRAYHSGDAEEIGWILRRFRDDHSQVPIFAAGISLGGNALLKWMARDRRDASSIIDAAAAISAPVDLGRAGDRLGRGINYWYGRMFLRSLKIKSLEKLSRYPGLYDGQAVLRADTLRDFDNLVTAPLHGFRDTDDYWTRAAAKPELGRIELPTLLLHARNDPFLPGKFLPEPATCPPSIECDFPDDGGHGGFVSGPFPGNLDWMPGRVLDFFDRHTSAQRTS
jgi:uncharacterized protein